MNNSVVFAGFAPTSLATWIVDAQAKLVVAVDAWMRAANSSKPSLKGTQRDVVDQMQTREQLYDVLNYHFFEDKLDQLYTENQKVRIYERR
jgi:2-methylisocitrate lyase-like PEP mutase family enzyme